MNTRLKYLPVNWKNGMSFSQDHLNQEYLAISDSIRDATALQITPYNYGLLGGDSRRRTAESLVGNINNERVQVSQMRAITQNGSRIEILGENWEELDLPISEMIGSRELTRSEAWYILLIADIYTRIPTGEVDPQESPRRKPNTRSRYILELMSEEDLQLDDLDNAIPIAKYLYTSSGLKKVEEYVPPCTHINSHEHLMQRYEEYEHLMNNLKELSEKIIEKITYKRRHSNEKNRLADDIDKLCRVLLDFHAHHYDTYRFFFKEQPPIHLVWFFAKMARIMNHTMDLAYDKSHMLQYFNQYATHLTAPQIGEVMSHLYQVKYLHYDALRSLQLVENFLVTFEEIFGKLTNLDYRELAPRDVVREDRIIDSSSPIRSRDSRNFRIKRPGRSENLGDDLQD